MGEVKQCPECGKPFFKAVELSARPLVAKCGCDGTGCPICMPSEADSCLTLAEALEQARRNGKSFAAAEVILCQQAASQFDEMAEQIITPINSKARRILQDMALAIRQVVMKYRVMDERFPTMMDDCDRLARRRRLLERCVSHLAARLYGHGDACICEGCRLVLEVKAMDQ